jgi:hypothetical protein
MGLAADFGKSIVRGAGYSIGRNLVGSLGRNRITSSYRERISDSYENTSINQKFGRSIFDYIDEREESVKYTHKSILAQSNWDYIKGFTAFIFGFNGLAFWVIFALLIGSIFSNQYFRELMENYPLISFLYIFIVITAPVFLSKFCLYILHFVSGTPKKKRKHADFVLEEGMKKIEILRNSYTEGLEVVKNTWGEEWEGNTVSGCRLAKAQVHWPW